MTTACPEELIGRYRADGLNAEESARLEEHLPSCRSCVEAIGLHLAMEKSGRPMAGDPQLIAHAVKGALVARAHTPPRTRRTGTWAMAAGLTLAILAGMASAAIWIHRAQHVVPPPAPEVMDHPRSIGSGTPPTEKAIPIEDPTAPVEVAIPPTAPSPPASAAPALRPTGHARVPRRTNPAIATQAQPAAPELDVKALFAAANEARRSGQGDRAGELYHQLQQRFPGSREAQLSWVSFGRLLFDQGRPAEALAQFERHLRDASPGPLAADAQYGKARALSALHRDADARRSWADLLARFPDSIYADTARAQLGPSAGATK